MRHSILALALLSSGVATAETVTRRALIVGANDGGANLPTLEYAHNDAWRVAEVLESIGGFDEGRVDVLNSPSAEQLANTLAEISGDLDQADGETLFLFYYSGHADARGLQLYEDIYDYEELKAAIRAIDADVHLGILDACRSGAVTKVKGATVDSPFLEEGLDAEGEAWIAASAADEDAQESANLQGSFFTHYLVSGLRGAADTGDGWVSLSESYSYAYDRTVARTAGTDAGPQHPAYDFRLQGNGDLKLTEVQAATAHIVLPIEVNGEITVLRGVDKLPVAEVAKLDDRAVTLALEPGTYVLKRRLDGRHMEVKVHLAEGTEMIIDRWSAAEGEAGTEKGATVEFPAMDLPDDAVTDGDDGAAGSADAGDEGGAAAAAPVDEWYKGSDFASAEQCTAAQGYGPEADEARIQIENDGLMCKAKPVRATSTDDVLVYGAPAPPADSNKKLIQEEDDALLIRIPKNFDVGPPNIELPPISFKNQPAAAGIGSALLPGLGQAYQGRWGDGLGFFLSTLALNGSAWGLTILDRPTSLESGAVTGPNFFTTLGMALYFWNVNDAVYGAKTRKNTDLTWARPEGGMTVSLETGWSADLGYPYASGVAVDWMVAKGFSIGMDRTGWVANPAPVEGEVRTDNGEVRTGARAMMGIDADHWRPAVFGAVGVGLTVGDQVGWREIYSVGSNVRYYPTPRYFLQGEVRGEYDRRYGVVLSGSAGLGFHLGS